MLNSIVLKLLNDSGKISLPTIGIFVKVDMEDDTAYLFTPSAVKVDARMVEAVMAEMDVPNDEAVNIITSYVEFIKNIIAKNGKYPFKGIGDVMINEQGVYYFVPVSTVYQPVAKVDESTKIEIIKDLVQEEIIVEPVAIEVQMPIIEPKIEEIVEPKSEIEEVKEDVNKEVRNEIVKEESRLNERFQPRRLGEIMEGEANKRFYDKVHSQVVAKSIDDIVKDDVVIERAVEQAKEVILEPVKVVEEIKVAEKIEHEPQQPVQTQHELSQDTLRDILGHSKRKGLYEVYEKGSYMDKSTTKPIAEQPVVEKPPIFVPSPTVTPPTYVETPKAPQLVEPVEQSKPKKKKFDFVLFISFLVIIIGLCVIAYFYYMQQELGL